MTSYNKIDDETFESEAKTIKFRVVPPQPAPRIEKSHSAREGLPVMQLTASTHMASTSSLMNHATSSVN